MQYLPGDLIFRHAGCNGVQCRAAQSAKSAKRVAVTALLVLQDQSSLTLERRAAVEDVAEALGDPTVMVAAGELGNLLQLAAALLASADSRTESRGAHSRQEFPESQASWRRRQVHGTTRT